MRDTPARPDAGTPLEQRINAARDRMRERLKEQGYNPYALAVAGTLAMLPNTHTQGAFEALDRLTAERERLVAENARLLEYYEANEMLEAECDDDVEAVHRAMLRFVSARRALAPQEGEPSDG
jgi:hypothetical protein